MLDLQHYSMWIGSIGQNHNHNSCITHASVFDTHYLKPLTIVSVVESRFFSLWRVLWPLYMRRVTGPGMSLVSDAFAWSRRDAHRLMHRPSVNPAPVSADECSQWATGAVSHARPCTRRCNKGDEFNKGAAAAISTRPIRQSCAADIHREWS